MSSTEMALEQHEERKVEQRVVELEIKMPKLDEIKWPKVNLAPARKVAEEVLLTGLGVAVLVGRGVVYAVKAANQAGVEASKNPGPVTKALLGLVRAEQVPASAATQVKVQVPVMPIDHYDALSVEDVLARLAGLSATQLSIVREYELDHLARPAVLEALANKLAAA